MINEQTKFTGTIAIVLAAMLCTVFTACLFVGAEVAEAKTYPAAEKKIEAAISKGRTWVDLWSADIPWPEAYKAFERVKRKKAGYIVKAKAAQTWSMPGSSNAYGMKISYRNATQRKALNAKAKAMMKKVTSWDSQSEKVAKIHDAIVKRCRYDYASYNSGKLREDSGSAYGSLVRGRSVCAGYAEAFQLVALKVGLQCRYVSNGNHAWNLVKVGGKWYHIDVCWDDTGGDKRKYFLKGSKTMSKVESHGIKDCYPSMVSISKKDYVEPSPPVEVIDDGTSSEDSASTKGGSLAAGNAAGGSLTGVDVGGNTPDGATSIGVKDPNKGSAVKPNDGVGAGEYTGGTPNGLSAKDPNADPAAKGNATFARGTDEG